jgi:hypothetical protein
MVLVGSIVLCLRGGRTSWWWEHLAEEAAHLLAARSQGSQEEALNKIAPKDRPPVTYSLQLGSTQEKFPPAPNMPSNYEFINGLI